ncbi:F-box protein GID2 [Salvia miltiorrhiza]|uniref:F-box protein GID2 n=1 Tax=Salvia miltiorrhiza TaxID=226208 RepID=UPI0025ACE5D8|nr:F-box protein GID2 [Salvia miltiorrhiza]
MKRPLADEESDSTAAGGGESAATGDKDANKKIKQSSEEDEVGEMSKEAEAVLLDENLLYEVLRRVDDGPTLAKAASVSRQWRRTAHDERIWELICTRHYHRSPTQLRAVVSALGGFRRLYSSHLWPLLKPASSSSSSAPLAAAAAAAASPWPCLPLAPAPPPGAARLKARWGKDEVNLSLSLLSIKYFEKMSFNHRSK